MKKMFRKIGSLVRLALHRLVRFISCMPVRVALCLYFMIICAGKYAGIDALMVGIMAYTIGYDDCYKDYNGEYIQGEK